MLVQFEGNPLFCSLKKKETPANAMVEDSKSHNQYLESLNILRVGLFFEHGPHTDEKQVISQKTPSSDIKVKGVEGVLVKIARCCCPLPGDEIVGYITKGHGITVHHANCRNLLSADPNRLVEVTWGERTNQVYPVKIEIKCSDKVGLLAEISGAVAKVKANIIASKTKTTSDHRAFFSFVVEVKDREQFQAVINAIRSIDAVEKIKRQSI